MNLTVKNLHKSDFAPYSCLSENALGKSDARIRLQGTLSAHEDPEQEAETISNKLCNNILMCKQFVKLAPECNLSLLAQ